MRFAVKLGMIFVLRWFYLLSGQTAGDVSTCSATATKLNTEATVTCRFPVDIRKSLLGFRVLHYKHNSSEAVEVVNCMWTNRNLKCEEESGYKKGNWTSESFELRIPHFLPNHTGDYLCELDNHYNENCTLHQLADTTSSQGFTATVSAVVSPAAVLLIIIVIIIIVIIVIVIIAVTQYRLRKKRHTNKSRTPGHDEDDITNTDQKEELIDQRQKCGLDNKLPSIRSRTTTSCETTSGRLTSCEELGQQTPLGSTNEVSSTSQTKDFKHADIISAMTALCTDVKQNAATKVSYQLDADGCLKFVYETGSPTVNSEQEPVSLGQLQTQSQSPCKILDVHQEQTSLSPDKTCFVHDKQSEEKTSIAVQEEVTANVHMRNTYEHPLEGDSISLKQTYKLKMLTPSDDSHTQPSLPLYTC